ncbi:MAG: CHASE2 domain-containing serine/threonine-protein kinase [Solirubrobacteraceae bacterium]
MAWKFRTHRVRFASKGGWRARVVPLLVVALICTGIGVVTYAGSLFAGLEGSSINTRFSVRGKQAVPKNLMVVAIDAKTFQDLNKQFPFPRAVEGRAISTISAQHPAAIAVDIQLSEPSELGQNDDIALLSAVSDTHGKVVFSDSEPTKTGGNVAFLGSGMGTALLKSVGSRPAEGSFPFDPGGVIRQTEYKVQNVKTLSVVTAEVATHKRVAPFTGNKFIDYLGPTGTIPYLSFSQAYWGTYTGTKTGKKLPKNFFTNKIVVIGATAINLNDIHPTSSDSAMPGPEIQANAINTVLHNFPLSPAPDWLNVELIALLSSTVPLASVRLGPIAAAAVAVVLGATFLVFAQLTFNAGTVVTVVYPIIGLVTSTGGTMAVGLRADRREHRRLRSLFAANAPAIVDQILSPDGPGGLEPTDIITGYRFESAIGRGGMGVVYRATQLALDRPVAIKLITPERATDPVFRERFKRESRLAAAIEHVNVIPVYEAGEDDGVLFIAMRLVEGLDLAAVLSRTGRIDPGRTTAIFLQLAAAIDAAHAHGLIHRDIKPANILLTFDTPEHVYLTDFGVAKQVGGATSATATGQWIGTMDYLAPEQISGSNVDGAADIYAATCVLCHCLTGQVPYPRDNEAAQLWAHINARPPAPSQLVGSLPTEIDAVIARGMAKNPRERYGSATELARACGEALGVLVSEPAPAPPPPSAVLPAIGAVAPTAVSE